MHGDCRGLLLRPVEPCGDMQEKINYFWIVAQKSLEDKKAELRNKEREFQDAEERHQVEIKVRNCCAGVHGPLKGGHWCACADTSDCAREQMYKQRLKHLLHECQNEMATRKTEAEVKLRIEEDEHRGEQADIRSERRTAALIVNSSQLSHEEYVRSLKRVRDGQHAASLQHFYCDARRLTCAVVMICRSKINE